VTSAAFKDCPLQPTEMRAGCGRQRRCLEAEGGERGPGRCGEAISDVQAGDVQARLECPDVGCSIVGIIMEH
jgi:hypothetical protein